MSEKPLILAVDDEEEFLEIVSAYLESSGFRAATLATVSQEEFLKRCVELRPAVALVDVYAAAEPVGLTLAAALKSDPRTAQTKVILWSSAPEPPRSFADDFFNKSEDLELLIQKIRSHLEAEA